MIASVLKDFNLFVDGFGFLGKAEEINPPKLTLKTEELRAGGMDVPLEVDTGMEKLEADFTLIEYDPHTISLWGIQIGTSSSFTARGSMQNPSTGLSVAVVVKMRGRIKELDMGTWKPGEVAKLKCQLMLEYYNLSIEGVELHEIDVQGMIRKVNGVDQLALTRANLGVV